MRNSMNTAMIWGASGGIGGALLRKVSEEGWRTVALTRSPEEAGGADVVVDVDVSDAQAVKKAVYTAAMDVESVSLWIYAAGDILAARTADMSPGEWERILTANLTGAFHALHYSMPLLSEDAQLVFLGAVSERLRLPGLSAYAASKAGLEALAECLRKEERHKKVLLVRPGAVATMLWEKVPMRLPKHALSPDDLAEQVYAACEQGQTGWLDL